jgi:hypothetical protein
MHQRMGNQNSLAPPTAPAYPKLRARLQKGYGGKPECQSVANRRLAGDSLMTKSTANSLRVGYKFNMTGRSIKGGGGGGRSNSPSSHSGMDPDLPRGVSSQLNF